MKHRQAFSVTAFVLTLIIGVCLVLKGACAMEISPGLYKVGLENGVTAIVKESTRSPVVAIQIWVRAGSSYEREDQWGITHLIEHMIFKGTEKRKAEEIGGAIEALGGTINAYTSLDYTVYHCVVPRQFWQTALDILSDAVLHASFNEKELEKEKKVVLEEIRMRDDEPTARLSKLLMSTAYGTDHPYGHPVIGFPDTVAKFTRSDILEYVREHYSPKNMTVLVVGDIQSSQVFPAIQKNFEEFSTNGRQSQTHERKVLSPLSNNNKETPVPKGLRFSQEFMDTQEAYVAMAFDGVPGFSDTDAPVYDCLAAVLGDGESSRLVRMLKNRMGLVNSIDAYAFTPRLQGLFEISMTLDPQKLNEAIGQLLQELVRVADQGVLDEELERAKTQVETDFVYGQETMEGEARKLGVFQTLAGDPSKVKDYLDRVRSITGDEIKQVARRIFDTRHMTVSMILPKQMDGAVSKNDLEVIIQEAELQARGLSSLDQLGPVRFVKKATLSNGITVLIREVPEVPTVGMRIVFPGGVRYESKKDNGIFNFLASLWTKGTETHSAEGLAEAIEGLGGSITGFSGRNTFGLSGRFLSKNFQKGLDLFAEILMTPSFPSEEVERLKPIVISKIKRQADYLPQVAMRAFNRLLFTPHPYSMDPLGTQETVSSFTAKAVQTTYNRFAIPSRAVLAIVGDVDADKLLASLETLIGGWQPEKEEILPALPAPEPLDKPKVLTIKREDREQTHLVLGFTGPTIAGKDRYPMEVLSAVLSGMGGRLFTDLRGEKSLAYHVTSMVGLGLDYGSFAFYIACAPDKKDRALKGIWKEVYRVLEEPVSQEEIERAKRWVMGRYEIGLQTNGAQAMDMALNELYGLGYNFESQYIQAINKVTPEDCLRVARKYLSQDSYVLVTVGP